LVHLDLDVLDESIGKVNRYESPGGLQEHDLMKDGSGSAESDSDISQICSFNPNLGDGDKVTTIGVKAIVASVKSLLRTGAFARKQSATAQQ
jgi:arginase